MTGGSHLTMLTSRLLSRSYPPPGRSRQKQLLFLLPPIVACGLPTVALWNTWMFWSEFPISGVVLSQAGSQSRSRTSAHRNRSETLHCPGTEPRSRSSEEQRTATPFSSATSNRFDMPDEVLPAQPVDATPSNQLIRPYFPWRTVLGQNLARVAFRLI